MKCEEKLASCDYSEFAFNDKMYIQQEPQSSETAKPPANALQLAAKQKKHHILDTLGRTDFKQHFLRYYTSNDHNVTFKLHDDVANVLSTCSEEDVKEALGPICKHTGDRCFFHYRDNFFVIKRTNYELDACMSAFSQKEVTHETGNRTSWSDLITFIDIGFVREEGDALTIAAMVAEFESQAIAFLKDTFGKTNAEALLLAFIQSADTYREAQLAPDVYDEIRRTESALIDGRSASEINQHNALIDRYVCAALECPAPCHVEVDGFVLLLKKNKTTPSASYKKYNAACIVLSTLAPVLCLFFFITFFIAFSISSYPWGISILVLWVICLVAVAVVFSIVSHECCGEVYNVEALQKIPTIFFLSDA